MVYIVLSLCIFFTLLWGAGLLFSVKSDGQRAVWIPVAGLLCFAYFTFSTTTAAQHAKNFPHRLVTDSYLTVESSVGEGMTSEEVSGHLGEPVPDDVELPPLAENNIGYPPEVSGRLRGERHVDAVPARMVIKITGEASKANLRRGEGLGASAADEKNGLMKLDLVLTENENTAQFLEGEHWEYTDDMTAEEVAQALGAAIDEHPSWTAEASPENDPETIIIRPELEENGGVICNDVCTAQIMTGPNEAVSARSYVDGEPRNFYGGDKEYFVHVWYEEGVLLDADFSTADRMVIAGYIDNELVGLAQNGGIPMPPKEEDATPAPQ